MSELCAIRDCEGSVHARHFCQRHYTRWIRHGHPVDGQAARMRATCPEDALKTYRRITESGCWEWTGYIERHGYGRWCGKVQGRMQRIYVHRLAWETLRGPIPEGLQIDHLCRNRLCFNPEHLEPVTQSVNVRRSLEFRDGVAHCRNGHEKTPDNTFVSSDGSRRCRQCARDSDKRRYWRNKVVA